MKKQGFTLIELMVVIVIMGILAAVAVPKLFAQIAKSKASEVGPAAGTYVHMMDAWVVDQKSKGSWSDIGYEAPSSKNITYSTTNDWTATAQFDVPSGCTAWNVGVNVSSTTGKATYNATGGCNTLTPNFSNIGAAGTTQQGGANP